MTKTIYRTKHLQITTDLNGNRPEVTSGMISEFILAEIMAYQFIKHNHHYQKDEVLFLHPMKNSEENRIKLGTSQKLRPQNKLHEQEIYN